jgi:hypothetical protein
LRSQRAVVELAIEEDIRLKKERAGFVEDGFSSYQQEQYRLAHFARIVSCRFFYSIHRLGDLPRV